MDSLKLIKKNKAEEWAQAHPTTGVGWGVGGGDVSLKS
jgi:hypothetical protein